jgi:ATP-dependent Lon protease
MRIDSTYGNVRFSYLDAWKAKPGHHARREEYPSYYHKTIAEG